MLDKWCKKESSCRSEQENCEMEESNTLGKNENSTRKLLLLVNCRLCCYCWYICAVQMNDVEMLVSV